MQGLAMLFGGSRGVWIGACVLQGALFGLTHAYQNPLGIAITGTLGVLMDRWFWRDHRTRALRREPFCFVLLSRAANPLISLVGRFLVKSSAIYQALIEPVLGRLADFDFFEIRMPGI